MATSMLAARAEAERLRALLRGVESVQVGQLDDPPIAGIELGRRIACPEAQAIAFLCTNWQSMAIIDQLERDRQRISKLPLDEAFAALTHAGDDVITAVAQVLRVRAALAAIANNGDVFVFE